MAYQGPRAKGDLGWWWYKDTAVVRLELVTLSILPPTADQALDFLLERISRVCPFRLYLGSRSFSRMNVSSANRSSVLRARLNS